MNIFSKLPDTDSLVSKLELENSRLRFENERLSGFLIQDEKNDFDNLVDVERRVRLRGAQLLSILDNLPSMFGYWDSTQRNRYANQAYAKWFGISSAKMLGMHVRDMVGEARYRFILPYITGALRGESQQFDGAITIPNGEMMHAKTEYIPCIVEGQVQGFFFQISDITAFKNAEQTRFILEFAFNQVHEAFFMTDESGHFTYVNNEACVTGV